MTAAKNDVLLYFFIGLNWWGGGGGNKQIFCWWRGRPTSLPVGKTLYIYCVYIYIYIVQTSIETDKSSNKARR